MLDSAEAQAVKLGNDYKEVLGRPLDAAGLSYWGSGFAAGASDEGILAGLLTSLYPGLANAVQTTSDPVAASKQFASTNSLFQTIPSATVAQQLQAPAFGNLSIPAGFDLSGASLTPAATSSGTSSTGTGGLTPATVTTALGGLGNIFLNTSPLTPSTAVSLGIIPAGVATGPVG